MTELPKTPAAETVPLRVDIPVDLHPDSLLPYQEVLDVQGTLGRRALSATREAMARTYEMWDRFNSIEHSLFKAAPTARVTTNKRGGQVHENVVMQDGVPRAIPPAEAVESYQRAAEEAQASVAAKMDRSLQEVRSVKEDLTGRVAKALLDPAANTPSGMIVASEIRQHVKNLPSGKRLEWLNAAVLSDDKRSVAAVLAGPHYLSDITADMHAVIHEQAARRWAPQEHAQLQAVEKLDEAIRNAGTLFMQRYTKIRQIPITALGMAQKGIAELTKRSR